MIKSPADAVKTYFVNNNLVEVAKGRPARQSSLSQWSTRSDAENVVSGVMPLDFAFHTEFENDPWWEVDLEWEYPLELIVIHNRRATAFERAESLEVLISLNQVDWLLIHKGHVAFTSSNDGLPFMLPLSGKRTARYIRLSLSGMNYLHLSQVEVYAKKCDLKMLELVQHVERTRKTVNYERKINLGILGTSNSIMSNGYTKSLYKDCRFRIECNLSLGSSHTTMIPYRLIESEIVKCDIVIFDLVINEQRALYEQCYSSYQTELSFMHIIATCSKLNVIPLFLLMPEIISYSKKDNLSFRIRNFYIEYCNKYHIPYFDGFKLVEALSQSINVSESFFFADPWHMERRCARILGDQIGDAILNFFPVSNFTQADIVFKRLEYIGISLAIWRDLVVENRTTSVVSADVLVMRPGRVVEFKLAAGVEVIGLVFNMAKSNAALRIEGRTETIKNLHSLYLDPGPTIWLVSWSLIKSVYADERGVRLECIVCDEDFEEIERNDHGNCRHATDLSNAVIELAGIVIGNNLGDGKVLSCTHSEVDLWKHVAANFILPNGNRQ